MCKELCSAWWNNDMKDAFSFAWTLKFNTLLLMKLIQWTENCENYERQEKWKQVWSLSLNSTTNHQSVNIKVINEKQENK